jgi:RNA polymerase sigma-70 factor (ECF subfamily)
VTDSGEEWDTASADAELQTSTSLLERVKVRDAEACRQFVRLYYPLIYGWCRRRGLQPHDASDITQDVLQQLAGGMASYRRGEGGGSFRAGVLGIARHKLADQWKRTAQQPRRGRLAPPR